MEIAAHNGVHGNGYDVLYSIKSQMIHYCPGNGGGVRCTPPFNPNHKIEISYLHNLAKPWMGGVVFDGRKL